jgi:DNA-binding transcriptional ArsR family regulator
MYKKVNMDSIRIEILNPKARKILKNLAELKLIKISDLSDRKNEFKKLLDKLRAKSDNAPSLEEIEKEVEAVRKARYEKKD